MPVKILCVAGARPNFIKIAPIMRALRARDVFDARLVHTGQHYDDKLSTVFFKDLSIPRPDIELAIGSASHAAQTAEIMRSFEPVLEAEQPEAVLVVGDVNSTVACAMVSAKFRLARPFDVRAGRRRRPMVIHVEAGLRSFDDDMPEEINRRLTDAISDVLYVSDPAGMDNLAREGVPADRIVFVGNVMIDTLLAARDCSASSRILKELGVSERRYGLLTLHRPSNVDDPAGFLALLSILDEVAQTLPLVFPIHPRTRTRLTQLGFRFESDRWILSDPLGYFDFLRLQSGARMVLTDSGGVQEETTVLQVPCVTLRENTERPCTISAGTNQLAGTSRKGILDAVARALEPQAIGRVPKFWDGRSAERIVDSLATYFFEPATGVAHGR